MRFACLRVHGRNVAASESCMAATNFQRNLHLNPTSFHPAGRQCHPLCCVFSTSCSEESGLDGETSQFFTPDAFVRGVPQLVWPVRRKVDEAPLICGTKNGTWIWSKGAACQRQVGDYETRRAWTARNQPLSRLERYPLCETDEGGASRLHTYSTRLGLSSLLHANMPRQCTSLHHPLRRSAH